MFPLLTLMNTYYFYSYYSATKISNTVNLIYYTASLYLSIKNDGSNAKFNNTNPANIIKPLYGQWKNSNMVPIPKEKSVKNAMI